MLQNDSFKVLARLACSSMPTIKVIDYEICFSKDPIKIYYSETLPRRSSSDPLSRNPIHAPTQLFSNIRVIVLLTIYYHRQDDLRLLVREFFFLRSLCTVTVILPMSPSHVRRVPAGPENKNQNCLGTYLSNLQRSRIKERRKRDGYFKSSKM